MWNRNINRTLPNFMAGCTGYWWKPCGCISGGVHAWHLYVIRIKSELWQISRNELIEKINEKGIGTSVHYKPVHVHSYYVKKYSYKTNDFPIAKKLSETVITLPLYPNLTNEKAQYIISTLKGVWHQYKARWNYFQKL